MVLIYSTLWTVPMPPAEPRRVARFVERSRHFLRNRLFSVPATDLRAVPEETLPQA